jgi:stage V sporulation protein G
MFSYSISVRPLNNQNSKLKAFVTLTIDDIMDIEGFKVINGSNGLFVSVPSHKGTVMEDGVSVEKYFDDVRFKGDEGTSFADELKASIIAEYNNTVGSSGGSSRPEATSNASRANAAAANAKATAAATKPTRERKPLWGY